MAIIANASQVKAYNPEKEIQDKIAPYIDRHEIFGNRLLVAIYKRDSVTSGGIMLLDDTIKEDVYQGTTGLVIQVGPAAFKDSDKWKFHGQEVKAGDWVSFQPSHGVLCQIGGKDGQECRVLQDCYIMAKLGDPKVIY